jgi:predicted phosphoribosyltransferase
MMAFRDRADAGQRLATRLARYRDRRPVVLALPRGGVIVAAPVAAALDAPLDLILVRKIGVPAQPELAMGAVVDGATPVIVRNDEVIRMSGVSAAEFDAVCARELAEIERRRRRYLGDRKPVAIDGRTAIVIDDGIATGATTRAALRATRARMPAALVLAAPVGPTDTLAELRRETDDVICLKELADFDAIGMFYDEFRQVTDSEVKDVLARFATPSARSARR